MGSRSAAARAEGGMPGWLREWLRDSGWAWRPPPAGTTKRVAGDVMRMEPPLRCMTRW